MRSSPISILSLGYFLPSGPSSSACGYATKMSVCELPVKIAGLKPVMPLSDSLYQAMATQHDAANRHLRAAK
jgi:hypothetical protein